MIASAHLVAGAVAGLCGARMAGEKAGGLAAGFLLGVASHHVLDAIPHSDYSALSVMEIRVVAVLEIILTLAGIYYATRRRLSRGQLNRLFAGAAGGVVMDVKFFQPFVPGRHAELVQRVQDVLHPFHAADPDSRALGLVTELAVLAACGALLTLCVRRAGGSAAASSG